MRTIRFLAFLGFVLLAPAAMAEHDGGEAQVLKVSGDVRITRSSKRPTQAKAGDRLYQGDRIRLESATARASLLVGTSFVHLTPESPEWAGAVAGSPVPDPREAASEMRTAASEFRAADGPAGRPLAGKVRAGHFHLRIRDAKSASNWRLLVSSNGVDVLSTTSRSETMRPPASITKPGSYLVTVHRVGGGKYFRNRYTVVTEAEFRKAVRNPADPAQLKRAGFNDEAFELYRRAGNRTECEALEKKFTPKH